MSLVETAATQGALEVIPGSHSFDPAVSDRTRQQELPHVPVAVPSGSVTVYALHTMHRGGANTLYFGRVGVPDPFIAFAAHGKKYAVVGALEFGRVKRRSAFDRVLALEPYMAKAREVWPQRKPGAAEVIFLLATELKQKSFTVPEDFPAGVYEKYTLSLLLSLIFICSLIFFY